MGKASTTSVQDKLFKALAKINRPGEFCTSGAAPAVLPGLQVDGLGPIGLPLTVKQAKELQRRCEQAPYGKGEETLVDTKVRRVWRMAPERFALTNPAWTIFLHDTVARVEEELGLKGRQLQPHLYDLLLYEKGSFFLPHRDSEKLDRMVATLIVVLPSAYEGGELVVRHDDQEQVIDFTGQDTNFQTHYAAFYADCEHEIKPLRSGYRLCLVYNLTLAKSKKPVGAPRSREPVAAIAGILRDWSNEPGGPQKLAVILQHQYTRGGLVWDALKGVDRAKAHGLAEAARQAGCQANLALLTLWESGAAEYSERSPRRWRGRSRYQEDAGDYEMGEIFDNSLTAEHWRGPAGERPAFGTVPVERNEIVPEQSLTAVKPEEDFEGYTGNAGMTLERWYRHAAVFVWPDSRHFDILCEGGSQQAVPALARMVSSWRKATGEEAAAQKKRCLEFAQKILAQWPENSYRAWGRTGDEADAADPMTPLQRLGDANLIRTYLSEVLVKDAALESAKATAKAVSDHGWATFRPQLLVVVEATNGETIERNVRLLERLCLARLRHVRKKSEEAEAQETCRLLAAAALEALDRIDTEPAASDWRLRRVERAMLLARFARALLAAGLEDLLSQLVVHALNLPQPYSLRLVHLPALTRLGPWLKDNLKRRSPALSEWIAACQKELELLTATTPQPPTDFRRDAHVRCKCEDCAELNRFLRDPREKEHSFQMPQDRRSHLESNIRSEKCDLDCTTNKRPRPQILMCSKNTASYDRRLAEYHEDQQRLSSLRELEESLPR